MFIFPHATHCVTNFPALWGHACETGCASKQYLQQWSAALLILKPIMAFKILFSIPYHSRRANFRWADVTDKDEIGKGSFGSVMKGNYIPEKKTMVVKLQGKQSETSDKLRLRKRPQIRDPTRLPPPSFVVIVNIFV